MLHRTDLPAPNSIRVRRLDDHCRAARRDVEAIILAAGRGSRLDAATATRPKCLLDIGGRPLIQHQIEMLRNNGIDRISVVTGYRGADVRQAVDGQVRLFRNDDWKRTNSMYSMSLCHDLAHRPILVLNCDVLAHPDAVGRLLGGPGSAFAYDSASGTQDEQMKVELRDGRLMAMSKSLPPERSHGENLGVLYFEPAAASLLFCAASDILADGRADVWLAAAVERVARWVPLYGVDVADLPWIEIDFPDDLTRARDEVWPRLCPADRRHAWRRDSGIARSAGSGAWP